MPISIVDTTITGLGVGGLPGGTVNSTTLADSSVTRTKMGYTGAVLQVQSNIYTNLVSFTANTELMTVSITPTSASNKILVKWHCMFGRSGDTYGYFKVYRNGSQLDGARNAEATFSDYQRATGFISNRGSGQDTYVCQNMSGEYLDSPATTAATTYSIYAEKTYGGTLYFNKAEFNGNTGYQIRGVSTITVMEIRG